MALQNAVDSHGSLGHSESAIKEVEKQIRATLFQMYGE